MADKQYYVKLTYEWGVDNEDGTFVPKTTGDVVWGSMSYDDSVGLQNYAVIPGLNDINTKSGELGLMRVGSIDFPSDIGGKGKGPNK